MSEAGERAELIRRARELGVELTDGEASALLRLLDELARWSRAYNLTAIRRRADMLTRHVLDSLSISADLEGPAVADVGTGAGFPGLPLAVANPGRTFTLIDSSGKKARFVEHAARILGLENVTVAHARIEALRPAIPFDTVVARAFASLPDLLAAIESLAGPGTRVLAMKGRIPADELAAVAPPWRIAHVRPLAVPGLEEARHLIVLERSDRYPAGPGEPILAAP